MSFSWHDHLTATALRRKPSPISALLPLVSIPGTISLGSGMPNPTFFPFTSFSMGIADGETLQLSTAEVAEALQYSAARGLPELCQRLMRLQTVEHSLGDRAGPIGLTGDTGSQVCISLCISGAWKQQFTFHPGWPCQALRCTCWTRGFIADRNADPRRLSSTFRGLRWRSPRPRSKVPSVPIPSLTTGNRLYPCWSADQSGRVSTQRPWPRCLQPGITERHPNPVCCTPSHGKQPHWRDPASLLPPSS